MKINITKIEKAIKELPNKQLADVTDLSPSAFTRYRKGRSVEKNISISNLIKLSGLSFDYNETTSDNVVIYDENEISTFNEICNKNYLLPYFKREVNIIDYDKNLVSDMYSFYIQNNEDYSDLKIKDYLRIVEFNQETQKLKKIDNIKILENFKRIVNSMGKSQMEIAIENQKSINYFPSFVSRHTNKKILIQNLSSKTYETWASIFYRGDVDKLKDELLS